MNSALKPVVASAGSSVAVASGQASPAKGSAAGVNHASAPTNSVHNNLPAAGPAVNNLQSVGQNLTQQHGAAPPAHAMPSMAPVTPNMAQMAANMSHHGNLTPQATATNTAAAGPVKAAPLSLVQDKPLVSQPLALTRTPEKKEPDSTPTGSAFPANGTLDSPKAATNAPNTLKPQNPETNKDKQDIAKTSPSTPKPPERALTAPNTPQKPEAGNSVSQVDGPSQPKVATANEPPEKSPSKPTEPKPAPTADVAPTQSDNKPAPESAKDDQASNNQPEKAPTPSKQEPSVAESSKSETSEKPAQKPEDTKQQNEKPSTTSETKEDKDIKQPEKETPKKEEAVEKPKPEEKVKAETKKESKPKSTLKLATVTPPMRKRRHISPAKESGGTSTKKAAAEESTPSSEKRSKRNRTKVQLYQSPTPEITMATKLSASAAGRSTPTKQNDDKLIVFYKNEYLAVRNAEGSFYVCQAMQNVYRTTRKIKIRWLSQDKTVDLSGETYKPDFYDVTDMECVLTTLSLTRAAGGGGAQILSNAEKNRATSILQRALRAEQGRASPTNPEHPDGLDLSLYTDESQLDKKSSRKRNSSKSSPGNKQDESEDTVEETPSPPKKTRTTPKRSPKSTQKAKPTPNTVKTNNNKRKALGSTSKTATAVSEKAKVSPKVSPPKRGSERGSAGRAGREGRERGDNNKPDTPPARKGRRSAAKVEPKPVPVPVPIVATPSTSTGKTGRTPRKPPSRKI